MITICTMKSIWPNCWLQLIRFHHFPTKIISNSTYAFLIIIVTKVYLIYNQQLKLNHQFVEYHFILTFLSHPNSYALLKTTIPASAPQTFVDCACLVETACKLLIFDDCSSEKTLEKHLIILLTNNYSNLDKMFSQILFVEWVNYWEISHTNNF